MNVLFSHPSEVYPQKDGRKVRSRWKSTFTFRLGTGPQGLRARQTGADHPGDWLNDHPGPAEATARHPQDSADRTQAGNRTDLDEGAMTTRRREGAPRPGRTGARPGHAGT